MPRRAKNSTERTTRGVESVDKALSILNTFNSSSPYKTLAQLAEETGLYKSTILRLINSLEDGGLLRKDATKKYCLGPRVLHLANVYQKSLKLEDVIRPYLSELTKAAQESASFFIKDGNQRLCLFRENSSQNVQDQIREGDLLPLEQGAAGKILRDFSDINPNKNIHKLMQKIPYISRGERDPAAAGIAAPVFSSDGTLLGAISLSGAITRFSDKKVLLMGKDLVKTAELLTNYLGSEFPPDTKI